MAGPYDCPEDQYVSIEDNPTTTESRVTVLGNSWWSSTKYWASLYAAGQYSCEYELHKPGGKYHGNIAIASRGPVMPFFFGNSDHRLDGLQATLLKHEYGGGDQFRWAVSLMKAEDRKAQFVDFAETEGWQKLLKKQGGYRPNQYSDLNECLNVVKKAAAAVEAANQLLSRTGTSIPERVYYDAVLFDPDVNYVRIRDRYLKGGELRNDLRWTIEDIMIESEYPLTGKIVSGHPENPVRGPGICQDVGLRRSDQLAN
ncbi:hypothetical protein FRC02_004682 [Tulasnella sp. 418]|nr:hypothetical protein FRC02_004682 [Tulasnella sp. 418]